MTARRRILNALGALLLLAAPGWFVASYLTAERRVTALCADIQPGMTAKALGGFAQRHGLRAPRGEGVNFLVEAKTFGRYGCRVVVRNGLVVESRYGFAD